jgi:hypothetical protein
MCRVLQLSEYLIVLGPWRSRIFVPPVLIIMGMAGCILTIGELASRNGGHEGCLPPRTTFGDRLYGFLVRVKVEGIYDVTSANGIKTHLGKAR